MKALQELVPNANKVRSINCTHACFEKDERLLPRVFGCWEMIDAGNKVFPQSLGSEFVPRKTRGIKQWKTARSLLLESPTNAMPVPGMESCRRGSRHTRQSPDGWS